MAASDLGFHCLSTSHKKDARLMWVKVKQKAPPLKKQYNCPIEIIKGSTVKGQFQYLTG